MFGRKNPEPNMVEQMKTQQRDQHKKALADKAAQAAEEAEVERLSEEYSTMLAKYKELRLAANAKYVELYNEVKKQPYNYRIRQDNYGDYLVYRVVPCMYGFPPVHTSEDLIYRGYGDDFNQAIIWLKPDYDFLVSTKDDPVEIIYEDHVISEKFTVFADAEAFLHRHAMNPKDKIFTYRPPYYKREQA